MMVPALTDIPGMGLLCIQVILFLAFQGSDAYLSDMYY